MENSRRKPEWLKIKLPMGQLSAEVLNTVRGHHLNTICTSGKCPNQGEMLVEARQIATKRMVDEAQALDPIS